MPKTFLALIAAAALLLPALAQERTKAKTASTFPDLLASARTAFEEGRYSACLSQLREAEGMVTAERSKAIRAALPAAPAGLEKIAPSEEDAAALAANPFLAAMGGMIGNIISQDYHGSGKSITVTVTTDSPAIQMISMFVSNPQMLEKGSEVIKYGPYNAVLQSPGGGQLQLQLVIDQTMIDVSSSGLSDDDLLKFLDQKAVDALAAALKK